MRKARLEHERNKEIQAAATKAAQRSPKAGKFIENIHAIDWHLVSPDGKHYKFRSLRNWLREHGKRFFGVDPDTRQFNNVVYGLARVKKSMMGTLPPGQRPGYSYKGWQVIPIDDDTNKNNTDK